jgi:hypothetical protein
VTGSRQSRDPWCWLLLLGPLPLLLLQLEEGCLGHPAQHVSQIFQTHAGQLLILNGIITITITIIAAAGTGSSSSSSKRVSWIFKQQQL